ncbi:MAG: peptidoglycan-binding protein [Candidatus Omnitrophica bacterium]|nr:peptidoglycan-binding protein [Candidatus Omnitrophota bacterium]
MLLRLLSIIILAVAVSGCATTQTKTQNEQVQSRLTELEKSVQSKDSEIVDLQYQVKDLSSKLEASKNSEVEQVSSSSNEQAENTRGAANIDTAQIIRVKASPEKIQKALKAAGVYTGRIDGRIGAATRQAIVEFQKSHGLKADGVLGRKTWELLKTFLK